MELQDYKVHVLGTDPSPANGCASRTDVEESPFPGMVLSLGRRGQEVLCDSDWQKHLEYRFGCLAYYVQNEFTFVWLHDFNSKPDSYQCAVFETKRLREITFRMAVSKNTSCDALKRRLIYPPRLIKGGKLFDKDDILLVEFSQHLFFKKAREIISRKIRAASPSPKLLNGCNFPDYAQGSFIDLRVDGGTLRYTVVEQEIKNADGKDENEDQTMFVGIKRHVKIIQRNKRHEQESKLRGIYNGRERRSLPDNIIHPYEMNNSIYIQSIVEHFIPPIVEHFIPYEMTKDTVHEIQTEINNMQKAWNHFFSRERRSASVEQKKNPDIGPIKNASLFRTINGRNADDAFIGYYLMQHCYNKALYNEPQNLTCWYCNAQSIEREKEIASCLNLMHKQRVRRSSFSEMSSYPNEELRNNSSIRLRVKHLDNIHKNMTVATAYMHMLLHTQFLDKSLDDKNADVNITEEESVKSRERRSTKVFWPFFTKFGFSSNKTEEEMENNTQSISPELEDDKERQYKFYNQICQRISVAEAYLKMFSEIALNNSMNDNYMKINMTVDEIRLEQGINYLQQLWMRMSRQKHPTCSKIDAEQLKVKDQSVDARNSVLQTKSIDDDILNFTHELKSMENKKMKADVRSFVLTQINHRQKGQSEPLVFSDEIKSPFTKQQNENIKEGSTLRKKRCFKAKYEASKEDDKPRRGFSNQPERRSTKDGNYEKSIADKKADLELAMNKTNFNFDDYDVWKNNLEFQSNYIWSYPEEIRNNFNKLNERYSNNISDGNKRQRRDTKKRKLTGNKDIDDWKLARDNSYKYAIEMYEKDPNRIIPSADRYIKQAEARGVRRYDAIEQWVSIKRAQLVRKLNNTYFGLPGQIHPDDVLKDFDLTYNGWGCVFDEFHPEGTAADPIAYLFRTLPGGLKIPANKTRCVITKGNPKVGLEAIQLYGVFGGLNNRRRRSTLQIEEKPKNITKFMWRCTMPVEDTQVQYINQERGKKFLVWGGELKNVTINNSTSGTKTGSNITDDEDLNDVMSYACLWLIPRGPNILEYSIIDMGYPKKEQDIRGFARELCLERRVSPRDNYARSIQKTDPRLQGWITESRATDKTIVPVACPVPPGTVYYGVLPAPPPSATLPPTESLNGPPRPSPQYCMKLVSSVDYCEHSGSVDRMKYIEYECVDPANPNVEPPQPAATRPETSLPEREYQCLGTWQEEQYFGGIIEKPKILTFTFIKLLNQINPETPFYECFVSMMTPLPGDANSTMTTSFMLTEASSGLSKCSRRESPEKSGIKIIGFKTNGTGSSCAGRTPSGGGSWYPLRPQQVPHPVPGADYGTVNRPAAQSPPNVAAKSIITAAANRPARIRPIGAGVNGKPANVNIITHDRTFATPTKSTEKPEFKHNHGQQHQTLRPPVGSSPNGVAPLSPASSITIFMMVFALLVNLRF